jgi:hypothetical protein
MTRAFNFGAKIAASMCSPCDTPNSPTNKKHMTGASPAVTDASEHSEEIGKPEVVETEHSEAEAKQPEEGIKSAANYGKMLSSLMQTPAQAGQSAMMAARNNLKVPTSAPYKHVDKSKFLMNPDQRTESLGWAASGLPGKPTHYSTGPDILPRRDALSSVGNTAARNQALTQGGIVGAGVGLGALSRVGQQPQPPEVKAKSKPPEMIKTQSVADVTKSAANFGKMLGGMFGAAKPAANNAADLATSLGAKAKTTAARTGNNVVMTNPATGVQETLARAGGDLKPAWLRNNEAVSRGIDPKTGVRPGSVAPKPPAPPPPPKAPPARSPAEAARAAELGLKPSDYVDGTPYSIPNSVANSSQTLTPRPIPVRQTGKVINGATGQVTGGPKPAPSYVTANRDARATALAKARSAQNPPPMPPTPRQFGESVYAQKPGSPMDFPQPPLPKPAGSPPPTAAPPPASYRSRAADDFNYGRTPLAPMPKKPLPPPPPPPSAAQRAADDFNYGRTPLAPLPKKPAAPFSPEDLTLE